MAREVNVHPFDAELMLRETADAALDATETVPATGVEIWGGSYAVQVVVPTADDPADTLNVEVKLATTVGGTYSTVAASRAQTVDSAGEVFVIPFHVPAGKYFVKITNTLTGTSPDFGTAIAGVIPHVPGEYDRKDHFA